MIWYVNCLKCLFSDRPTNVSHVSISTKIGQFDPKSLWNRHDFDQVANYSINCWRYSKPTGKILKRICRWFWRYHEWWKLQTQIWKFSIFWTCTAAHVRIENFGSHFCDFGYFTKMVSQIERSSWRERDISLVSRKLHHVVKTGLSVFEYFLYK